jgi:hypothetical protein
LSRPWMVLRCIRDALKRWHWRPSRTPASSW